MERRDPPEPSPTDPRSLPAADGTPETTGFQMSGKRVAVELALVVGVLVGLVGGVLGLSRWVATRYAASVPLDVDRTFGEQTSRLLATTSPLCDDPAAQAYVERIAAPLVTALADPRFSFSFVVADDPEVNAFALPGGFVTVNRGLLESAESGDEVAAVLAHELTHVTRRHSTVRLLRELGATAVLSGLFGGTDVAVPAKALHDFLSTAYDRDQEREADEGGLAVLRRANIDPRGMARFFDRLAKTSATPPALLSTHPDPGDRAENARKAVVPGRTYATLPAPPRPFACKKP
ncbi:MAG TPA: M48 family metallopeptidase [Polyangiaceae bacterium]|nr:M48 family metallopeptidase [Polyangiaceae bacterium]